MNQINVAYYINLDARKDRRSAFESQLKYLNIKNIIRIKAVEENEVNIENWPGSKSEFAIRESHILTLEHAKNNNYKKFIVFEDDTIIPGNFYTKLSRLLLNVPEDWDMIYLYAENHYIKPIKLINSVLKLQNTLGMVAIVYNSKNLDKIISKLKNDFRWVDSVMADLHIQLNVYAPQTSIVLHSFGYSDNLGKYVDYKNRTIFKYVVKLLNLLKIK